MNLCIPGGIQSSCSLYYRPDKWQKWALDVVIRSRQALSIQEIIISFVIGRIFECCECAFRALCSGSSESSKTDLCTMLNNAKIVAHKLAAIIASRRLLLKCCLCSEELFCSGLLLAERMCNIRVSSRVSVSTVTGKSSTARESGCTAGARIHATYNGI